MKWWPGECTAGDMIRIKIGAIYHYGIFVSEDEIIEFGEPPVGDLLTRPNSEVRVCTATADEFSCGNIIEVAELDRREKRERIKPKKTVEIARSRVGEGGYNLIHNNCEHFVYECVFGVKKSTQEDEARERWRSRPILAIYLANTDGVTVGEVKNRQRSAEIAHTKNETVRAEKYTAWKTLEFASRDALGKELDECSPKKHANGRWTADGMFFSISHSSGTVAVAVSNAEVGIDIESVAAVREKFTPGRIAKLGKAIGADTADGDCTAFLREWTRRESIYKRNGRGAFVPSKISADGSDTRSCVLELDGGIVLSYSGKHAPAAQIWLMDKSGEKTPANNIFKETAN